MTPALRSRGLLIFAVLSFLVAPAIGLDSFEVDDRIAEVWPVGGVGFLLCTTVWTYGARVVAATCAAMAGWVALTAVVMGLDLPVALWVGLTGALQPLVMALLYRRLRGGDAWIPTRPADVAYLLASAVGTTLVVGLLGGYPTLWVDEVASRVIVWWVLRSAVFCFVVAAIFAVLFDRTREEVLPRAHWANTAGLVGVSALCVLGTYHDPSLPLSWLLIVPSVWGGLTLTLRGTAWLILLVAMLAAGLTYLPQNQFGYDGWLPAASIVDLLVIASTCFALLLTLMRDQRARLILELDAKGRETEAERELLAVVLDSINEGVMVIDERGVQAHNVATRSLLGRAVPTEPDVSWVDLLGVTGPEGETLDEAQLHELVHRSAVQGEPLEVRVGSGRQARVLSLVVKPLAGAGHLDRGAQVVLLQDVTAQRARLRELTSFAGQVAHDLRGPLTVLDGWLEVALDEETSPPESAAAIGRAHEAGGRMRQVIEDWIGYTVVQQGRVRPVDLKLHDVAAEVVESRRTSTAGVAAQVELDLTHTVRADPALLRQLLDNLVDNAVKYTAPDRVPEVVLRSRDDAEPGWVQVEVVDNGVGVPEGQEEQIFEEFHRGPSRGRSEGTGLGLALTRRIVATHGGIITARRNPEQGSTFRFTLPAV